MMRRVRCLVAAGAFALVAVGSAPTALAATEGQIDHIEATGDGTVQVLYSLPAGTAAGQQDLDAIRVEVDGAAVDATAARVEGGDITREAVLALDVSQSMQGSRFAAAKQAAQAYLDTAPDDVAVGLVTFAGEVDVVVPPTTDHAAVTGELASVQLTTGTRLYDGILQALDQLGTDGQRQVVVLSDGADTGSTALADVVAQAERSGATVSVVSLEQSAANEARLRQITDATAGTVLPADDPQALARLLTAEAEALAQQVLVEFTADRAGDATVTLSLTADGRTFTDSALASLPAATGAAPVTDGPRPVPEPAFVVSDQLLLVGVGALGLGLAVILGVIFLGQAQTRQTHAERQLAHYSSVHTASGSPGSSSATDKATTKHSLNVRESAVALAHQVVRKGDLESRLTSRLAAGGVNVTAAEWLLLHAGIVVLSATAGLLLSGGNPVLVVLLVLLGAGGPWVYLSLKRARRLKAFGGQLADTLQLMSGGLSAGLSLPQAVDTVVREGAEPIAGELKRALVEQRLGVDIEDALDGVAQRMESKDFGWVVMAIRIQREVGGNLAELLNTVAATLREREYLRRQVLSLSAEGRLSAWILGGLPPFFAAYLALVRPDYISPLVTHPIGWVMSAVALGMLIFGAFWLAKTVKVEV